MIGYSPRRLSGRTGFVFCCTLVGNCWRSCIFAKECCKNSVNYAAGRGPTRSPPGVCVRWRWWSLFWEENAIAIYMSSLLWSSRGGARQCLTYHEINFELNFTSLVFLFVAPPVRVYPTYHCRGRSVTDAADHLVQSCPSQPQLFHIAFVYHCHGWIPWLGRWGPFAYCAC